MNVYVCDGNRIIEDAMMVSSKSRSSVALPITALTYTYITITHRHHEQGR